jgi:hypothetical protein
MDVGPEHAGDFGLRAEVERTGAGKARFPVRSEVNRERDDRGRVLGLPLEAGSRWPRYPAGYTTSSGSSFGGVGWPATCPPLGLRTFPLATAAKTGAVPGDLMADHSEAPLVRPGWTCLPTALKGP